MFLGVSRDHLADSKTKVCCVQFVVPTPPQLPMQQLTLDNGPSKPGPPPRNPSWTGSQARVGYGAPVSSPPSAAPSARVSPR